MDEKCCTWGCREPSIKGKLTEMADGRTHYLYYCAKHWRKYQSREELETEITTLKQELEEIYLKDRGKTNEINILTRENNTLFQRLQEAEGFVQFLADGYCSDCELGLNCIHNQAKDFLSPTQPGASEPESFDGMGSYMNQQPSEPEMVTVRMEDLKEAFVRLDAAYGKDSTCHPWINGLRAALAAVGGGE
jgi:hypothetical protein